MLVGMQGGRYAAHQNRQRLTAFLTFLRKAAQVLRDGAGALQGCSVYNATVRKEDVPGSGRPAYFSRWIRLLCIIVAIVGARWCCAYNAVVNDHLRGVGGMGRMQGGVERGRGERGVRV